MTLKFLMILLSVGILSALPSAVSANPESTRCDSDFLEEAYVPAGEVGIATPPMSDTEKPSIGAVIAVSGFCISVNEISARLYSLCVDDDACVPLREGQIDPELPVHSVTYDDVLSFINWLNKATGHEYRLPSEAEWQHAALGGIDDPFPWRTEGRLPQANIFSDKLVPVGTTSVNEFGVRDMVGNLIEYVADCFTLNVEQLPTEGAPFVDHDCETRLAKGGYYSAPSYGLSPYFRFPLPSYFGSPQLGFRVVRKTRVEISND